MNKTFNINIAGYVFTVNEDAYTLLKDYLDTLHTAFSREADGAELLADIESRIAEIFGRQNDGGVRVITVADVEAIISRMGRPEDLMETDETISETSGKTEKEFRTASEAIPPYPPFPPLKRRLFRNPANKMLGGVCSGLAAYLGIDPTWMRLIAVLLAFASLSGACVVYIILWLVVPEARTPIEVMQMQGESATMENIGRTVTESFRSVRDDISQTIHGNMPQSSGKQFADGLASFFGFIGKILLICGIVICCAILLGLGIGLLGCILALIIFLTPWGASLCGANPSFPPYEGTVITSLLTAVGYIMVIGIPLFYRLWLLLKANGSGKQMAKGWKRALIWTWVIGFILAGATTGILVGMKKDFKEGLYSGWESDREIIYDTVKIPATDSITDSASEPDQKTPSEI